MRTARKSGLNPADVRRPSRSTKTRSPPASIHCQRTHSYRLPKQAQLCCVSLQAQYQAFVRFAVESSTAQAIALDWTCVLEPFTRRALDSRTLAPTRYYGGGNPGPMLWAERSRSRGIFQVIFCISIGLYEGNFRPPTARAVPARSAFGGRSSIKDRKSTRLNSSHRL